MLCLDLYMDPWLYPCENKWEQSSLGPSELFCLAPIITGIGSGPRCLLKMNKQGSDEVFIFLKMRT